MNRFLARVSNSLNPLICHSRKRSIDRHTIRGLSAAKIEKAFEMIQEFNRDQSDEQRFIEAWSGQVCIVASVEDVRLIVEGIAIAQAGHTKYIRNT